MKQTLGMTEDEYAKVLATTKIKKRDFRIHTTWIISLLLVVLGWYVLRNMPQKQVSDIKYDYHLASKATQPKFVVDPTLTKYGAELGIPEPELEKTHAHFGNADKECSSTGVTGAVGCAHGNINDYQITVSPNRPPYEIRVTLGYEYLHYVWALTPPTDKVKYTSILRSLYYNNPGLQHAMRSLEGENKDDIDTFNSELFSMVGTRMNDTEIPSDLLSYYKQYLPNRDALPSQF